ncbi:MAG: galactose-1-phosphate uridylyltransferase, partial [Methanoregulaceae archaeon]|nr:galactose-1-phosphate uridylyltransferase [Methanoregulaceae archaeon]
MFTVTRVPVGTDILEYRKETLTGYRCRIASDRLRRGLSSLPWPREPVAFDCPFCPDRIGTETPTFSDGTRLIVGESTTFPNLFPFAEWHTVTVITRKHVVDRFSFRELRDAFSGQVASLENVPGYPSINWNYLSSAGASLAHPHLQGMADRQPTALVERYLKEGSRYLSRTGRCYWTDLTSSERSSERYLFGDEICWFANPVPLGDREVRGVLPIRTVQDMEPYLDKLVDGILSVIELYGRLGTRAFNAALFFDRQGPDTGFRAFCSVIARINPNEPSLSDSAFMERLHLEPVILTLPEE